MRPPAPAAVLFDLDGTLIDSAPDLCLALNALRAEHGRDAMPLHAVAPVVSKGARAMLGVGFADWTAEAREDLVARFLALYAGALAVESRLYDGIGLVLRALDERGLPWGIVTNKPEGLATPLVRALGLAERCAVLVGGDTLPTRKPDPAPLLHACAQLAVAPAACVYVGDDQRDAVAARAAGMRALVALWGYREDSDDPSRWGGDALLAQPLDLLAPEALWPGLAWHAAAVQVPA